MKKLRKIMNKTALLLKNKQENTNLRTQTVYLIWTMKIA
jgi:hypothetical protein